MLHICEWLPSQPSDHKKFEVRYGLIVIIDMDTSRQPAACHARLFWGSTDMIVCGVVTSKCLPSLHRSLKEFHLI